MEPKEGDLLREESSQPEKTLESKAEQPEAPQETKAVEPETPEETGVQIEAVRTRLQTKQTSEPHTIPSELYGDFLPDKTETGKIVLVPEVQKSAEALALKFRREAKFMTNTIIGEPIAAEYDIRTRNFSTQTRIFELPDGRKVFIVYDHKGSTVHRILDNLMKWASGLRMRKVWRKEWKARFETKSTIPVIENSDPDTILMPFLPNVNGFDLFAQNSSIKDFGECEWAKDISLEDKMKLADKLVDEVARIHESGTAWGELILPNVIFTKDQRPVICDPEVKFYDDVSLEEAKAQDLKDLCVSISGALAQAHGQEDPSQIVNAILERYPDKSVLRALQKLVLKKRTFLQNLTFGYEQVRTGTPNKAHYDSVLKIVRDYEI